MQALVAADNQAGWNARALVCPTPFPPDPDNPNDVLSNTRWREDGIVSDLSIDPEELDGPCRHEARWRLEGPEPEPALHFWREMQDCDGEVAGRCWSTASPALPFPTGGCRRRVRSARAFAR